MSSIVIKRYIISRYIKNVMLSTIILTTISLISWDYAGMHSTIKSINGKIKLYKNLTNTDQIVIKKLATWWKKDNVTVSLEQSSLVSSIIDGDKHIALQQETSVSSPVGAPSFCRYIQSAYITNFTSVMGLLGRLSKLNNHNYVSSIVVKNDIGGLQVDLTIGVCHVP